MGSRRVYVRVCCVGVSASASTDSCRCAPQQRYHLLVFWRQSRGVQPEIEPAHSWCCLPVVLMSLSTTAVSFVRWSGGCLFVGMQVRGCMLIFNTLISACEVPLVCLPGIVSALCAAALVDNFTEECTRLMRNMLNTDLHFEHVQNYPPAGAVAATGVARQAPAVWVGGWVGGRRTWWLLHPQYALQQRPSTLDQEDNLPNWRVYVFVVWNNFGTLCRAGMRL